VPADPAYGGYESSETCNDGIVPALWVGAAVVGVGALVALVIPRKRGAQAEVATEPELAPRQLEAA